MPSKVNKMARDVEWRLKSATRGEKNREALKKKKILQLRSGRTRTGNGPKEGHFFDIGGKQKKESGQARQKRKKPRNVVRKIEGAIRDKAREPRNFDVEERG